MLTKRGLIVTYVNLLLITAVVTVVIINTMQGEDTKRAFPDYVDTAGITCTDDPNVCGEHGDCVAPPETDPFHPEWTQNVCICHGGWTHFDGVCSYHRKHQLNVFMASFFGGSVGADWFYLFRGGNGGYIVAGIFKFLTGGGFSFWWLVDWIRVLTFTFPDSQGVRPSAMY